MHPIPSHDRAAPSPPPPAAAPPPSSSLHGCVEAAALLPFVEPEGRKEGRKGNSPSSAFGMRVVRLVRTVVTSTTTTVAGATLKVGDTLRSHRRRFTEGDVAVYAGVSGDRNPVHLDDAFARGTGGFERGHVVHGMLVASLFPALIASHFPGAVYASQSLKFAAPVYVGDEVAAQVQALHIKATGRRHIVKFATKCFTADEEALAIDGEAMAFLPTLHLQLSSEAISDNTKALLRVIQLLLDGWYKC